MTIYRCLINIYRKIFLDWKIYFISQYLQYHSIYCVCTMYTMLFSVTHFAFRLKKQQNVKTTKSTSTSPHLPKLKSSWLPVLWLKTQFIFVNFKCHCGAWQGVQGMCQTSKVAEHSYCPGYNWLNPPQLVSCSSAAPTHFQRVAHFWNAATWRYGSSAK